MLLATRPGYRRVCVRARFGCTCFYYAFALGHRAKALQRRIARRAESRLWPFGKGDRPRQIDR